MFLIVTTYLIRTLLTGAKEPNVEGCAFAQVSKLQTLNTHFSGSRKEFAHLVLKSFCLASDEKQYVLILAYTRLWNFMVRQVKFNKLLLSNEHFQGILLVSLATI